MNKLQTLEQELVDNKNYYTIIRRNPTYNPSMGEQALDTINSLEAQIREIKLDISDCLKIIRETFLSQKWKQISETCFTKSFFNKETNTTIKLESIFFGENAENFSVRFVMTADDSILIGITSVDIPWNIEDSHDNNINTIVSEFGNQIVLSKEEFEILTPKVIIISGAKPSVDLDAFKSRLIHNRIQVKRILKEMLWIEVGE